VAFVEVPDHTAHNIWHFLDSEYRTAGRSTSEQEKVVLTEEPGEVELGASHNARNAWTQSGWHFHRYYNKRIQHLFDGSRAVQPEPYHSCDKSWPLHGLRRYILGKSLEAYLGVSGYNYQLRV